MHGHQDMRILSNFCPVNVTAFKTVMVVHITVDLMHKANLCMQVNLVLTSG